MSLKRSLKLDLHIHSKFSKDGNMTPEQIISVAKNAGLDGVAITDHNSIMGGIETSKLCDDDFIVIVGSEIMTSDGEIIGLGLSEDIPKGLSPLETCNEIKKQGGISIPSHPFDKFRKGIGKEIESIVENIDAVETFNSRTMISKFNDMASLFAEKNNLPKIASSDSHFPDEVGSSYTIVECEMDSKSVIREIKNGRTKLFCKKTGINPHLKTFKQNMKNKIKFV